jgi:hypothetical protein
MGWNSWDCYGASITGQEFRDCADVVADRLKPHGWRYVVIDIQWQDPEPTQEFYGATDRVVMDEWGRFLPAPNRFPSAAGGAGFRPLADYAHERGLGFGIHIVRGIPRGAVAANLPILGSEARAADVADRERDCVWCENTWGIDVTRPGGQAYYDSIAQLYAEWGVDYIKADDMCPPRDRGEIAALSRALARCGRPIVLSLSGQTPIEEAEFVKEHAHLWRISADLWDAWQQPDPGREWAATIRGQFPICAEWIPHAGPGHWPDPDMLPLGRISLKEQAGPARNTRLTADEQRTTMTLWCIARAPLMFGGDPLSLDEATLALVTNDEVLAVNQRSRGGRQLSRTGESGVWAADAEEGGKYVALFNVGDDGPRGIAVGLAELGLDGPCEVRDLWACEDLPPCQDILSAEVPAHGAALYRVGPTA